MITNSNFEKAYALIIGISKYRDPRIPELRFTRADAEGIYKLLTDPKKVGLDTDNIKILLDSDATRFNIRNSISNWLFRNADQDSIVFIYFAGHGGVEEDRLGIEKDKYAKYLLPYDTVFDDLYSSAISNRDFNELLLTISSKKLVIFMDSCYSGGVSERKARDLKITEDPYEKLGEGEGRIVIAASKPDQRSFEDSRLGHGIFTYNLIEALSGKADGSGMGYVTVLDAWKYLQDNVPVLAKKMAGGEQNPVLRGDVTKDFAISIDRTRVEEIEKEWDRKEKLKKLREFYRADRFSGKLYEKLRVVAETDIDTLENKDKDVAKLINDLVYDHISLESFLVNLEDIVPELIGKKLEEHKPEEIEEKFEKHKKFEKIEEVIEIKGKILNQNTGSPLDNVTISFKLDKEIEKIISDEKGLFSFNVPHKYLDQYIEYEATRIGYQTRKGRYRIKDKRNRVQLEINLDPDKEKVTSNISTNIFSKLGQGKIVLLVIALIVIGIFFISQKPELSVSPHPLYIKIDYLTADENASGTFSISNSEKGTLDWKVSADKDWLNIYPASGTGSGTINFTVNTAGLQPGNHSGIIIIKSNGGDESGTISINILEPPSFRLIINNSIGMSFVQIPRGAFDMGSPSDEPGRFKTEGPLHNVDISKDFYMSQYEVTRIQWFNIMGPHPSGTLGDNLPVVKVSWKEAQKFINLLNERERTKKYRLPSEAEWEYAARAGMTTNYSFGTDSSKLGNYAWYEENSQGTPHPVGQKKPNLWGLYDIHGNVFEWVQDDWHDDYNDAPTNESAWTNINSAQKVVRGGGSWASDPLKSRLSLRLHLESANGEQDVGFRIVKDV
jgi:formylglycine-generating enzyme required for sulfatase activity/uncharacterized caspase-like protein